MAESHCPWKPLNSSCKDQCMEECKDYQRQRVYCWEEMLHSLIREKADMSLEECRRLVDRICYRYGINPPQVKDGRGSQTASCLPNCIQLPRLYRERITTIHEASHILAVYKDPDAPAHGPIFVRYLVNLLPQHIPELTSTECVRKAREFGLDIADETVCLPPYYEIVDRLMRYNETNVDIRDSIEKERKENPNSNARIEELEVERRMSQWMIEIKLKQVQAVVFPSGLPEKIDKHLKFLREGTTGA